MKNFITFIAVAEKQDNVEIDVDISCIESIIDGRVMNNPAVTQINMKSGIRFFVNHTLTEVRNKIKQ